MEVQQLLVLRWVVAVLQELPVDLSMAHWPAAVVAELRDVSSKSASWPAAL